VRSLFGKRSKHMCMVSCKSTSIARQCLRKRYNWNRNDTLAVEVPRSDDEMSHMILPNCFVFHTHKVHHMIHSTTHVYPECPSAHLIQVDW
jgi:hypothetical protein